MTDHNHAQELIKLCRKYSIKITTAESCTGGLISSAITSISGSSEVFDLGLITYSNDAKVRLLNVSTSVLSKYGAVSKQVCTEMSENAIDKYKSSNMSIAVTGIAGPKSDSTSKEIGLVYISISMLTDDNKKKTLCNEYKFGNIGRDKVRISTKNEALRLCIELINQLHI